MSLFSIKRRKSASTILVAAQFLAMSVLPVLAAPAILAWEVPLASWGLAVASVVLFSWTLMHNRLGNFNIRPIPKTWGTLVTIGPYRWVRHPMYTAVLLGAASLAIMAGPWVGWAIWAVLGLVLFVKSTLEERWMREQHLAYDAYARESKRFLPLIF